MPDTTELDALRAEVAALRAEVRILRDAGDLWRRIAQAQPQIHHHYPSLPQPAPAPVCWPTGTALPPGWQWPGSGIRVSMCAAGAADNGAANVYFPNAACADQMAYVAALKTSGCAGGNAGQVFTVPA